MSNDTEHTNQRRRVLLLGGIAALVVVLILVLWWASAWGGGISGPSSPVPTEGTTAPHDPPTSPSVSKAPSSTPSPLPSQSGSSSPSEPGDPSSSPTGPDVIEEMPPVGLGSEAERSDGVVIILDSIEAVDGEAHLPGEIAGPALRLTILIENDGDSSLNLNAVVVNGYRGEGRTPLETVVMPGGQPFSGELLPGNAARGIYLFSVAQEDRADVTFTVDATAGDPVAVFRGDAR